MRDSPGYWTGSSFASLLTSGFRVALKQHQHTTFTGTKTTLTQVVQWAHLLTQLHARIASRFARPEPRRRALAYLQGLLSCVERKNGWQLAEHAREATPYGMQRLLSHAVWDADLVRDDLRSYVLEQLGDQEPIVVIDETSFPKRGDKSAGVQMHYCGTTGQVENCQVGVFLAYVTARGHTLVDRELYLPLDWTCDRERCQAAGIPESVRFQTKPELARQMLERLFQAQLPIAWVVADTVYGGNLDLRSWLEAHDSPYVLAVACDEPVGILTPDGRRRRVEVREVEALVLRDQDWQRLAMSEGTKGPRLFDWACVPILHQWEADGRHWLLMRRSLSDPQEKTYYFVFAPTGTTVSAMVKAIGARWHIEEDFETSKDLGLDRYEVRSFIGWYRHITLVLLAHAFLTGICAHTIPLACPALPLEAPATRDAASDTRPLLPLTVPEVRHLLGQLIWPASSSAKLVLAWSWWRRWHRGLASYFHTKRRLKAG
jgi:SRSO17 transposase